MEPENETASPLSKGRPYESSVLDKRPNDNASAVQTSTLLDRWRLALAAIADTRLSKADVAVLMFMADHMNQTSGEAFPSVARMTLLTGLSERTVRRATRNLVCVGYLQERPIAGRSTRYRLATPANNVTPDKRVTPDTNVTPPLTRMSEAPDTAVTPPLTPVTPELAYLTPLPNQIKEPAEKISPASRAGDQKEIDDSFIRFWKAYPRKDASPDAKKAWRQVKGCEHVEAILEDIAKRKADPQQWTERQFTPMPASYLRKQRWLDEWQPESITDRVRRSAEDFANYDFGNAFGKPKPGCAPVPSEAKAAELNAKADARLAKLGSGQ